ncbi:DEAD/DEAH box helicase [Iodobacter fluviatilis]|uniref:ATP-dependent RNA helicase rhlE n=1 Tax=Iodobacter fluviatilis TaxID=537 RepID=A0A377ST98_9NEIS|nr:DEAD/DEAH box helicase [Iodobacter fluviatilis]TCU86184.1 superfamily II DNA/RNA helicase [Iodobacter fluviatilis]STR44595.1 ATP-dependent RNA helicase rhlE [Iodobacter fluviatilis]
MSFSALGLSPAVLLAASKKSYITPTPVQAEVIPAVLWGEDILAQAQTGSGKTAAYVLPLLHLMTTGSSKALILVPTRELAVQVGEEIKGLLAALGKMTRPIKLATVFGGVAINPQMMLLRGGADVLVATPGRLLDLIDKNAVRPEFFNTLVLDEADRLLDMGFAAEINRILALLPAKRQSLFFSATFPEDVNALATGILNMPTRVMIAATETSQPDILQRAIFVDAERRADVLAHLIKENAGQRMLVFVSSKHGSEQLANTLYAKGINAAPFHGEFSQGRRNQVLAEFKSGSLQVVVATDLAGRGIDIDGLPLVVNYDLPRSPVDYTHRIGRTGRNGASGTAISLVSAATEAHFRLIETRQNIRLSREVIAGFEAKLISMPVAANTGGVKGVRMSKKDKLRAAAARAEQENQ